MNSSFSPFFVSLSPRSARAGPALADQRDRGVCVGERADGGPAAGGGGDDGGVVLADGGHRAAQERRHRIHLPRIKLKHDASVQGGGHATDEP